MATPHRTQNRPFRLHSTAALAAVFDNLGDARLLARLWSYRANGRPGYPLHPLWRAYVASFYLNLGSTNDLIRLLHRDRQVRKLCGFGDQLPHRTTFNRFISRLSHHPGLVEESMAGVTNHLRELLPDLGSEVAIDSTTVRTHSNPNRHTVSDLEASWTPKNSAQARKGGKEWRFGYKLHMVADANHGIPLVVKVTTAKRNDTQELPAVMDQAKGMFPWFQPRALMADRGYDAMTNFQHLHSNGTLPVIKIRQQGRDKRDGIYTRDGTPTCLGQVKMDYVRTDGVGRHLYRCRAVGCELANSTVGLAPHCKDEVWEDHRQNQNIRVFGPIRRGSQEWKELYAKRQSVERTFKSLKQSRRLERHCVRGLRQVRLHSLMAVLVYQATALVTVQAGAKPWLRWMVAKVA